MTKHRPTFCRNSPIMWVSKALLSLTVLGRTDNFVGFPLPECSVLEVYGFFTTGRCRHQEGTAWSVLEKPCRVDTGGCERSETPGLI